MWVAKISDEVVLDELKSGMSLEAIRDKHGLSKYWVSAPRAQRLLGRTRKEQRKQEFNIAHPVTTYCMSPEEIERRYGPPGALAEKKEYMFKPEMPKKTENRRIDE